MESDVQRLEALWKAALRALDRGDFSGVEAILGGPEAFDARVVEWCKAGRFDGEPQALAELFACACLLGRTGIAEFLLDRGVDLAAGTKSGQSGFHYAASGGHLDLVRLLAARKAPLEMKNMYGGTVLGQACWSAVNQPRAEHRSIIEALIEAGADVEAAGGKDNVDDALRRAPR